MWHAMARVAESASKAELFFEAQEWLRYKFKCKRDQVTVYRVEREATSTWRFIFTQREEPYCAVVEGVGPRSWSLVALLTEWPA